MGNVNEADLDWNELERDETRFRRKQLGEAAGGEKLGASLYELPPGAKSWPYHYHEANEEAVFVLDGDGTLRIGGDEISLEAGDYVALPTGESGAHRVVNDGDEPLRYLMVSTMVDPDVLVYPDSQKVGVMAGSAPGGRSGRSLSSFFRLADDVSYWDGEA